MQITPQQKTILQKIFKDEKAADTLKAIADEMIYNWNSRSCVKEDAFTTSKAVIEKEAKINTLTDFINVLEEIAYGE